MWTPFKELHHTVEAAVLRKQPDAIQDLEKILKKHKPDFLSLLQNPAKNKVHRESVKRADKDGIAIQGQQATQTLTRDFIEEALIISDLFNLNEYAAVELLLAGENQLPYFPGLTRGLVAVILYYDGRTSVVNSLRTLVQAREGRTFTLGLSEDLVSTTTKFTDQLMAEGLTTKILGLLREISETKEINRLQQERGLGNAKHRKQVTDLLKEVRQSLADCLFCWACQTPLSREDTLHLLNHLKKEEGVLADGTMDQVSMTLLMTLLYCLDLRILEQEDAEEVIQKLPIVADDQYIPDLHREIVSLHQWTNPGMKAVVQFTWAVTLRSISQYSNAQGISEYCEQDERIIDNAIEENVFFTLREVILKSPVFHKEEFFLRQIHNLVADFIVQMPLKIKELRNRGDEAARIIIAHAQEGLEPPSNLRRDFEQFLMMIGDLYNTDPLNLELAVEYWCPPDPSLTGMSSFNTSYNYKPPNRQISLYKFVRHAGDLLPPSLYIPYIQMLTGLANGPQCAHHCYNLLKTNGGQAGTVSWDHFFTSMNQYYNNLRQEVPVTSDMAHVYRHQIRGITPQEVEGLSMVLKLTRMIAEQDEAARVALCDNQHWLPVVVLLGLVSCSIPAGLKAELLLTLAAFAKSPEISASLWQSIEVSQILPTLPTQSMSQPGGIQVELDEVEARNEEFPMTLGFLELMKVLTENPVPAALGAGYRAPGFDPYLKFLKDSIFLKFNTRAYKNPAEKWDVGASVLEVLFKLLYQHEVVAEDFIDQTVDIQGGGTVLANKSPGHNIIVHLLNDTSMLKMILYIIDEAAKLLDSYVSFAGKEELENASLLCLKILDLVFTKQENFLAMLRDSGASFIVSPMENLLLGINPRSGRPDHILNVAKYVAYNSYLPEHSLYAVKILCCVAQGQSDLVGLFTAHQGQAGELLNGFVECLEMEEPEELDPDTQDEELISGAQIRNATRQSILNLLLQTLDQQAPNLAHFLLGFETRKPVAKTNLQDPGVLGSPRTCLHSVLTLLDRGVGGRFGPSCLYETPKLAELSYQLLYVLSANKDTSGPTLRYLRTAHDFLFRHLQHVPFQLQDTGKTMATDNSLLNQQSWLLKCVAIELRTLAVNRQRSHTQRLINLLLDDNPNPAHKTQPDGIYEPEFSQFDQDFFGVSSYMNVPQSITGGQIRRKLLSILDSISLSQTYPEAIQLEFFDPSAVDRLITGCEQKSAGVGFCNVKVLHKVLTTELNNIQGATAGIGQRQVIVREINAICANVVERNACRESLASKKSGFEAWRQIVEVALTACPDDLLQGESRQNVIFEVLQDLLIKVADEEAVPELTGPVAGVILTLLCNLRHCFLTDQSEIAQLQDISHYITLLDAGDKPVMADQSTFDQGTGSRTLYSSSLQVVLKGLIDYILKSSSGLQRVRANLYGALLYYLQIAQKPISLQVLNSALIHEKSVGAMLSSKDSEFERLTKENMSTIGSYGDNLMQIVCRDACDGHNVGRMLALGVLDSMLTFDVTQQWLTFMSSKGYVQHIVDSLLQDDDELQAMLSPQPAPLKALYIYQSKMGLLTRVAESATGAQTLLRCGLMTRLAECTVFDMRPDADRPGEASFIPTVMSRYRQLLLPALKLCLAILTSLGIENRTSSHQVLQFIIGHVDVFSSILRDRQTDLSLPALQELAITTSVLSRCAAHDIEEDMLMGNTADIEYRGHLARIQRQMVALLPRYCLSDKLLKQVRNMNMESESSRESKETQSHMIVAIEEIASNVIAFCRSVVSKSGTSAQFSKLLFGPSLMEATSRDYHSLDDLQSSVSTVSRPPNLGVVVYMLRQCTNQFLSTYESHKHSMRKLDSVAALSTEELDELCGGQSADEKLSSQQKHSKARRRLLQIISSYTQQLQLLSYIIENCLFILWRHLEFYLLHCVPSDTGTSLFQLRTKKQHPLRRLQDLTGVGQDHSVMDDSSSNLLSSGVSSDELDQLKMDTMTCINDSLFNKLHEIEQCYAKKRTRYGFLEALVRRLKRLVKIQLTQSG